MSLNANTRRVDGMRAQGWTMREIAAALGITTTSVAYHVKAAERWKKKTSLARSVSRRTYNFLIQRFGAEPTDDQIATLNRADVVRTKGYAFQTWNEISDYLAFQGYELRWVRKGGKNQ